MIREPHVGQSATLHLAPGLPPLDVVVLATGIIRGAKDDAYDVPLEGGGVQGAWGVRTVVDRPTTTVLVRETVSNRVRVADILTLRALAPIADAA